MLEHINIYDFASFNKVDRRLISKKVLKWRYKPFPRIFFKRVFVIDFNLVNKGRLVCSFISYKIN